MRLLAEILIISARSYFGWNKPFKEQLRPGEHRNHIQVARRRHEIVKTPEPVCTPALASREPRQPQR